MGLFNCEMSIHKPTECPLINPLDVIHYSYDKYGGNFFNQSAASS